MIHPTAIIHPHAVVPASTNIGPYTVIEQGVRIGANCKIGPHCHLLGQLTLGDDNVIHTGCVLGDSPQDVSYDGSPTWLTIGSGNLFREHVTVHRGSKKDSATLIGNHNSFLAHCHVAHNCKIGNHAVIVNAVLLGGHVEIEDRAFLGGGAVVHQFCKIGSLSMLRGLSRISKDVPPFCMAVENNELVGLNVVGMKRAGHSLEGRKQIKTAYQILFQSGLNTSQALEKLEQSAASPEVTHLIAFIRSSLRGTCRPRRNTIEIPDSMEADDL